MNPEVMGEADDTRAAMPLLDAGTIVNPYPEGTCRLAVGALIPPCYHGAYTGTYTTSAIVVPEFQRVSTAVSFAEEWADLGLTSTPAVAERYTLSRLLGWVRRSVGHSVRHHQSEGWRGAH